MKQDDRVAMASAGPYPNHLHPALDRQPRQQLITQFFTGRMLFLMPINSVKAKGNSVKPLKTLASKHARPNYFVCHINLG